MPLLGAALVAALVAGPLVAPTAEAGELTRARFHTALMAAITAAAVFEPGTTLRWSEAGGFDSSDYSTRTSTVNQDGSLVARRVEPDVVHDVRCTGVDSCWQRVTNELADPTWYPMAPGSVGYDVASLFYSMPHRDYWRPGSTFSVAALPDGSRVFTASVDRMMEGGRLRIVDRFVVSDRRVTWSLTMRAPNLPSRQLFTTTFRSQATPEPVAPPDPAEVGVVPDISAVDVDAYADANGEIDWNAVPGGVAWELLNSLVVEKNAAEQP